MPAEINKKTASPFGSVQTPMPRTSQRLGQKLGGERGRAEGVSQSNIWFALVALVPLGWTRKLVKEHYTSNQERDKSTTLK